MGLLFENYDRVEEFIDSARRMSKSARSRNSVDTCNLVESKSARSRKSLSSSFIQGLDTITDDYAFSEMSGSDEYFDDEGRLSRALQSWMSDYVIVPIEPLAKPKRQLVYSGRLGKKPNLKRVSSDESLETKISLLTCSTGKSVSSAIHSNNAIRSRRRKRIVGSRVTSAIGRETPKEVNWEEFAKKKSKGAFDKFMRSQNAMRIDNMTGYDDDESEQFHLLEKDEQVALFKSGLTFGVKLTYSRERSDSLSNNKKKYVIKPQRPRIKRTLSAGAKPQSKPINLEEIRQQRLKEKLALQKQRQQLRRQLTRRSIVSSQFSKASSKSSITSDVVPNTPSVQSLSTDSEHQPVQMWKGDREILEMDLRMGLTERVQKRIIATSAAINRVTGMGQNNSMQRPVARHEEFPYMVGEDYANVPKIVQRIRISPALSQVIQNDIKVRMGRPRYHEIRVKDIEQWTKNQKLDRSHRNLKVFNWLHSLREDEFEKDIEPYIDYETPCLEDNIETFHIKAADEPDVKPLYLKNFELSKPK